MSFITTHLITVKLRNLHPVKWSVDPTKLSLLSLSSFLVFLLLDQAIELCKDSSVCSQTLFSYFMYIHVCFHFHVHFI